MCIFVSDWLQKKLSILSSFFLISHLNNYFISQSFLFFFCFLWGSVWILPCILFRWILTHFLQFRKKFLLLCLCGFLVFYLLVPSLEVIFYLLRMLLPSFVFRAFSLMISHLSCVRLNLKKRVTKLFSTSLISMVSSQSEWLQQTIQGCTVLGRDHLYSYPCIHALCVHLSISALCGFISELLYLLKFFSSCKKNFLELSFWIPKEIAIACFLWAFWMCIPFPCSATYFHRLLLDFLLFIYPQILREFCLQNWSLLIDHVSRFPCPSLPTGTNYCLSSHLPPF